MFLNDLGINPYEWFDNPLDSMPIAKDEPITTNNRYAPPEKMLELESSNPRPEEDIADDWFDATPCSVEPQEETPHHIAYEIATAKYNPFSVGGSESIHDFQGGSENASKK